MLLPVSTTLILRRAASSFTRRVAKVSDGSHRTALGDTP